ncbi:glycosyltransferase family 2 protein [Methanobacterium sp. ACI-7]|uniref:glycosyltransferase family 2 protein n=1 Tax=unclassified Methanobacterium TaxID=2627676 RepID=UPI0039C3E383
MTKITAILPAYNEEIAIGSMVIRTKKYVDHIIVVDDGSADNTVEIAESAGAEVIKICCNKGKGTALKMGFKASIHSEIIVTMDSDGQHNPEDIPKLVKPIQNGEADIVNGSRYLNGNNKNTPSYRRFGQTILDKATKLNSGLNITDSQSGFRAFAAHTLPAFRFKSSGFGIESEMLADASQAGFQIKEVEIGVRYDVDGSTKHPVTHGLGVLMKIIDDIQFHRPLFYFTVPGFIIIIIGLVMGFTFFGEYLAHTTSSLLPTVLAALLTLGGGFLAITGIILDSMSKMLNRLTSSSTQDNAISEDIDFNQYIINKHQKTGK